MSRSLDILYVGMLPPHPGGSGISWAQLLSGLFARGHLVRSVAPITRSDLERGDPFAIERPQLGVVRYHVPHHYTGPNHPAPASYRQLEREQISAQVGLLVSERRPQLMIAGRESFAPHMAVLARRHRTPWLLGIRGNTTMAILQKSYPADLTREMLESYAQAQIMVAVADHMAYGLRALGMSRIVTIHNVVDGERFAPGPRRRALLDQLGIVPEDRVLAHVSNLKEVKRPQDIVASAELVLKREPRALYLIIGEGAHRREMQRTCRAMGLAHRFRFVGWVDNSRIADHLNLAEVVVQPSSSEGLSRVYLETMACGRVLLASDIAPACEVIEADRTGLLFRLADIDHLTAQTLRALRERSLREAIGAAARRYVLRAHSIPAAVAAYEDLITRVLAERGGQVSRSAPDVDATSRGMGR